jgi:hypothetical protein
MATRPNANRKSPRPRKRPDLTLSRIRSALTNDSRLFLGDVAETGPWCRRLRDLHLAYESDLGGNSNLSEGQRTIINRLCMMQLQLEMMESHFAKNEGEASANQLSLYQRTSNSMRRLVESLRLHHGRIAKDITPEADDLVQRVIEEMQRPTA